MTRPPRKPARPTPLRLSQIARAGEEAAYETAKAFVDKALKNGGVIDPADLERAGPDVRRIALDLMGEMAVAEGGSTPLPAAPLPGEGMAPGRVDKNWADQRHAIIDMVANPFLYGFATAAVVCPFLVWLVDLSGL